ncbi:RDD family protein [Rhodocaloribacter litoris]|uniref:RDD family protein n=1 Tax=Rhodocaloribacter litoris TaxID=2558931 RepID=UPI00142402AF|nr:RDD family protein [Rhodocaloribacter litoris]QXD17134.1 RDD family protein [Rhodocaloribacter litoris]
MNCPNCHREIAPGVRFCTWCGAFVVAPGKGRKANLFRRWLALAIDPLIGLGLYLIAIVLFGAVSETLGVIMAVVFPLGYLVWYVSLFRQGLTPGKKLLGLQVVREETGEIPGFGTMLLREVVGRFLSGLFLGIGYFWALFDRDAQAWHDKLAGTVVLRRRHHPAAPGPPPVRTTPRVKAGAGPVV